MTTPTIIDLASRIAKNTAIYDEYLSSQGLPTPSHHILPPKDTTQLPPNVQLAREEAIEAAHDLHELLLGPAGMLMSAAPSVRGAPFYIPYLTINRAPEKWHFIL